jgi:alkanesulfonate monooxygenase SsuD/methylene tetrahydromethanopterin reductase-like flavin-dependent oxidoreductase (luciferase family)
MHLDILLDPFGARWADVREAAIVAADAGFSGIWTFDHLDGRVYGADDVLECWTLLTAIATTVPDVVVGPLVLNVANRDPAVLAMMAATLQEVSGGRLILGLGAGGGAGEHYAREQAAIGRTVPADTLRRVQVETCIEKVRALWQAPGFLHPDPPPPFVIGAIGPKMAELAGRVADGINIRAQHPRLHELVDVARDAHVGRENEPFLVTVFTQLDEHWLRTESEARGPLDTLDVDRLVLFVSPPYDSTRIAGAAAALRDSR